VSSVDQAATQEFSGCDMQHPCSLPSEGQGCNCDRRNNRNKQRYRLSPDVLRINEPGLLIAFHAVSNSTHDRHNAKNIQLIMTCKIRQTSDA